VERMSAAFKGTARPGEWHKFVVVVIVEVNGLSLHPNANGLIILPPSRRPKTAQVRVQAVSIWHNCPMVDEELEDWFTDPFGRHEARWMSHGVPTSVVRDGRTEGNDPVVDEPFVAKPVRISLSSIPQVLRRSQRIFARLKCWVSTLGPSAVAPPATASQRRQVLPVSVR
jgi:hypothetical protein